MALIPVETIAAELAEAGPVSAGDVAGAARCAGRRIDDALVKRILNEQVRRGRLRWLGGDLYCLPKETTT